MANPAPAVPPPGLRIHANPTTARGRSLHATRRFAPGSQIATFGSPLVAIPPGPRARTTCNWCLRPSTGTDTGTGSSVSVSVSACTGCRCVAYCSRRCQAAAWKVDHKLECEALRRVEARTGRGWVPTPVRAAMLLLLRLGKGDAAVMAALGDVVAGRSEEGTLEGNVDGFKRDEEVWMDLRTQAVAAAMYAGFEELAEAPDRVTEMLCKIQTNAFDQSDPDSGMAGIVLDPMLAMANHSCFPNAFICFAGRTAILRAEREIEVGDEIEISYIDYTLPKTERQDALRLYHFQCQCPRCVDDLDVYQVCQRSPLVPLNQFSLQPDLQRLLEPPIDRASYQPTPTGTALPEATSSVAPEEQRLEGRLGKAKRQWGRCKPLIEARMFALEPVPTVLHDLANFYQSEDQNFAFALSLACFLATECHPYAHVAPFKPWRVKGVMLVAGLLSQTAPLSMMGELANACSHKELVAALSRCDQVSMCEALLRMVVRYGPIAHSEDWDVLGSARELLEDIEALQGRERESILLRTWATNPQHPDCKAFFEEVVLKPLHELASFAIEISTAELGSDSSAVVERRG